MLIFQSIAKLLLLIIRVINNFLQFTDTELSFSYKKQKQQVWL